MTARVFMISSARPRKIPQPQHRCIRIRSRLDGIQHVFRNTDIGDNDLSRARPARHQQVRGLSAEKSDGQGRCHIAPKNHARIAMDTAGHVDGDARHTCLSYRGNDGQRDALQRTRKPCAEKSIDV